MSSEHEGEIEIEDMDLEEDDDGEEMYMYPCPCGDLFFITVAQLRKGEDIGTCPSCSLIIRVIYDREDFPPLEGEEGAEAGAGAGKDEEVKSEKPAD